MCIRDRCGDLVKEATGLPIPGNIIGMLMLFFLLLTGLVKLDAVEDTAEYLTVSYTHLDVYKRQV